MRYCLRKKTRCGRVTMNERLIMIGLSISLIFDQFQPDVAYTSVVKVRVTRFCVKYHTGLQ